MRLPMIKGAIFSQPLVHQRKSLPTPFLWLKWNVQLPFNRWHDDMYEYYFKTFNCSAWNIQSSICINRPLYANIKKKQSVIWLYFSRVWLTKYLHEDLCVLSWSFVSEAADQLCKLFPCLLFCDRNLLDLYFLHITLWQQLNESVFPWLQNVIFLENLLIQINVKLVLQS
jgi:hypothetical protein